MSTRSGLKALVGPRVRVGGVPLVRSGSPARFLLIGQRDKINTPGAALALARRHLPLRQAHAAMTRLANSGHAVVELPKVENAAALVSELGDCGIIAKAYGPRTHIDVAAIRAATGLTQEEFALEFGLELATVRNWEQGRSEPDAAARNLLLMIARDPAAVRAALIVEEKSSAAFESLS